MYREITIDKTLFPDGRYGVAFSGGRDSAALLYAMKQAGFDVVAVNVEHGIRGERSVGDSEFAKSFCEKYGVPIKLFKADAPAYSKERGLTLEQGARELRYSFFDSLLNSGECDYIALAHHACDQTETILMRILRGTGVRGLCGMRAINGKYVRPLLSYKRSDIDAYVKKHEIEYVEDETNSNLSFTRNFLRAELETLRERFPSLDESFARLARNAAETEDFILSAAGEPRLFGGEAFIPVSALSEPVTAKRLIFKACAALGVTQDIEERHFRSVFALKDAENGKRTKLTHGVRAHRDGDEIVFSKAERGGVAEPVRYEKGGFSGGGIKTERVPRAMKRTGGELYLDEGKLPEEVTVRGRQEGDRFRKFGGGEKSLGDFMTDLKIPLRKRESVPILACGRDVYAVCGYEISSSVAVDADSKEIVRLTLDNAGVSSGERE